MKKAFLFSFVGVFLMVTLSYMGVNAQKLISPKPQKADIFEEKVRIKLEQTDNDFNLKKPGKSLVEEAQAAEFSEANAYGVIDLNTGEVLDSKNLSEKIPIASLTKIMTAVIVLDLANSQDLLTVSESSTHVIPSKVFLEVGEKLTVEELLNCFLLSSANDCAVATKDGIDSLYGQPIFIKAMNEKAKFLGLKNTHFENPTGFDDGHPFSSVEDLSLLSHYALTNYPLIAQIVQKPTEDLVANNMHHRFYLNNWNGLLGVYPGVKGIKIGNTDDAGHTTIVASDRKDQDGNIKSVLAILLGAPGIIERDLWASQLLNLGFEKLGLEKVDITEEDLKEKYATWKLLE